jgi:hypothetical protein
VGQLRGAAFRSWRRNNLFIYKLCLII